MSMTMESLDERLDQMAADMRSLAAKAECHHMEIGGMKVSFSLDGGKRFFLFFGSGKSGNKMPPRPSTACTGERGMSRTLEDLDVRLDQIIDGVLSLVKKTRCYYMEICGVRASFSWDGGSRVFLFFGTGKSGYKISHKPSTACAGEQCND